MIFAGGPFGGNFLYKSDVRGVYSVEAT